LRIVTPAQADSLVALLQNPTYLGEVSTDDSRFPAFYMKNRGVVHPCF
jgi:hypothetical protein